jgi:hypothetical protein
MNDYCISLGDCGSYVNYAGVGTDNIDVDGSKSKEGESSVDSSLYSDFGNIDEEFFIPLEYNEELIQAIVGYSDIGDEVPEAGEIDYRTLHWIGGISGSIGTILVAGKHLGVYSFTYESLRSSTIVLNAASVVYTLGAAFIGFSIGSYAGAGLAKLMGIVGSGAEVMTYSFGGIGAGTAIILLTSFNVLGGIILGISAVIAGLTALIGLGKTRTHNIEFECLPWQAPTGEADCSVCNENPYLPCTKYRCESLGQNCELINNDTTNPICVLDEYDLTSPNITAGNYIDEEFEFANEEFGKSVDIINLERSDGCIRENTKVKFMLETDDYSQCKYDFTGTSSNYEDKDNNYPIESNSYTLNHTFEINVPSLDQLSVYDIEGDIIERIGDGIMYVRCQNTWEKYNHEEYRVNFCISSEPDGTAVDHSQTVTNPEQGSYLAYGENELYFQMWINEPAECRYSSSPNIPYESMENSMTCRTNLNDEGFYGWPCEASFEGLTNGENNIYIKCKDQPWISEEDYEGDRTEENRQVNTEDFVFTVYNSESELFLNNFLIYTLEPEFDSGLMSSGETTEIYSGFQPLSVELEATTSGGMQNTGEASCKWGSSLEGSRTLMEETFSSAHKQTMTPRLQGQHVVYVECEDEAGNTAQGNVFYNIYIDENSPNVVRAYRQSSNSGPLTIITDEDASCYYNELDSVNCGFLIDGENSNLMSSGFSTEHSAPWNEETTYYIKCEDVWGNSNEDCAIIVKPSEF